MSQAGCIYHGMNVGSVCDKCADRLRARVERLRRIEAAARKVVKTFPRWCIDVELELRDAINYPCRCRHDGLGNVLKCAACREAK